MNHVVYAGMRKLCDTGILSDQLEVVSERSFPTQRFVFAAQIFQTFTDVEFLVAILLLHSLETSSAFAQWTACGERPRYVSVTALCVGELRFISFVKAS